MSKQRLRIMREGRGVLVSSDKQKNRRMQLVLGCTCIVRAYVERRSNVHRVSGISQFCKTRVGQTFHVSLQNGKREVGNTGSERGRKQCLLKGCIYPDGPGQASPVVIAGKCSNHEQKIDERETEREYGTRRQHPDDPLSGKTVQ
eukprot:4191061-Pleurochrysis_carterae.AAC.1